MPLRSIWIEKTTKQSNLRGIKFELIKTTNQFEMQMYFLFLNGK